MLEDVDEADDDQESADDDEPLFTEGDLQLMQKVVYDPSLTPKYQDGAGALTWKDEWPPGDFSANGFSTISHLWVARSFLHHGHDLPGSNEYGDYLRNLWQRVQTMGINWPGFEQARLSLSDEDKAYLQREKAAAAACKDYLKMPGNGYSQ